MSDYRFSLDTLYLSVKYPSSDIYKYWAAFIADETKLSAGIPARDFVLRRGAHGYKFSVWSGDVRAFLTDRTDEVCGEGKGMGIWLQLGPKFLNANYHHLAQALDNWLMTLGVAARECSIKVTQLDLVVDALGVEVSSFTPNDWVLGWVGWSSVSNMWFEERALETVYVGRRGSAVYLRVYDKVAEAKATGDLDYWKNEIWDGFEGPVMRVEWEIRPQLGGFTEMQDFYKLTEFSFVKLALYLFSWGRLCLPHSDFHHTDRWKLHPVWQDLVVALHQWADGVEFPLVRSKKQYKDISEAYVRFVAGTISGAIAKFATVDPSFGDFLEGLGEFGFSLPKLNERAAERLEVIKRLRSQEVV